MANEDSLLSVIDVLLKVLISFNLLKLLSALATVTGQVSKIVFWDQKGVVPVDFLEGQKTVSRSYFVEILRKLRTELAKKCPGKLH